MARTIADIKAEIGNSYIADSEVQERYGFTVEQTAAGFDALFSKVSVESLLFYAVAFAVWTLEKIMDAFRIEIQANVDGAYIAGSAWWHAQALKFQYGDMPVIDPVTFKYGYATLNADKQIVKRCAVREVVNGNGVTQLDILVNPVGNNVYVLTDTEKSRFEEYCQLIKPAGLLVSVRSENAVLIGFDIAVKYNPMVMNGNGTLIRDTAVKPVNAALALFIDTLTETNFGGALNTTKLTDALQGAEGVTDVHISKVYVGGVAEAASWGDFSSNSGWFALDTESTDIGYIARI